MSVRWRCSSVKRWEGLADLAAGEDDAPGLLGRADAADGEAGVIGAEGSGADEDGIDLGAEPVGIGAGALAGQPLAFGGETGNAAIERERALGDDEREAGDDPFVERRD